MINDTSFQIAKVHVEDLRHEATVRREFRHVPEAPVQARRPVLLTVLRKLAGPAYV